MKEEFTLTGLFTDLYELSMAEAYFLGGKHEELAVFDYFFRKLPFEGGYAVFAGSGTLLTALEDLRFQPRELDYLKGLGFNKSFLKYLRNFKFRGNVYAPKEGTLIFPTEPVIRVEGGILESQLIETLLLNIINFQSLIATKASRMRLAAKDRYLVDFGLRRAQGLGGYHAARAAIVGGFDASSNTKAALDFGLHAVGTMAHSFVQSFDDEISAFRDFASKRPNNCTLLVDTYDTLHSGIPNAITVAQEMEAMGKKLAGIRLDSGDLAYLSKEARKMLDMAGLYYVKITASNQLDEQVIKSLLEQGAPIDVFGVGTSLVTAPPDAAFDGVYKLAYAYGKPRIKISENLKKVTLPGKKQTFRVVQKNGTLLGADVVGFHEEIHFDKMVHPFDPMQQLSFSDVEFEPVMQAVMKQGEIISEQISLEEAQINLKNQLKQLPDEYKRFENPHVYKVGLSEQLHQQRLEIKERFKK
ncbi:nicotinate phosphoribosyltransferase [Cecembia calidifontis]|jgi:nicotinate phosphoribosyltransferase|uniref:Nicotinate phosphoribosyltransferase n=1 Tax=Cecembia calidifontis TaxID=1187080 RepID=A0A4Q7PF71_9BACT|nr:nicotinate phosphoribosyltransferase [Cecembia calidifontis]RZS97502.1 nicotinate phosphoribosyltransferase [Cecembia calidifontis]